MEKDKDIYICKLIENIKLKIKKLGFQEVSLIVFFEQKLCFYLKYLKKF